MRFLKKQFIFTIAMIICFGISNYQLANCAQQPSAKEIAQEAMVYYKNGDLKTTLEKLDMLVKLYPKSYDGHCLLGIVYGAKGNVSMSEKSFQNATKLNPNDWLAYSLKGDMYKFAKLYDKAITSYEQILQLPNLSYKIKKEVKKNIKEIKKINNKK